MSFRQPLLLAAAVLALAACGGDPEKQALRAYEAAVERLMTEDEEITARLKDLRQDFDSNSTGLEDLVAYGTEQALPFYRRFRETAAKTPAEGPRLGKIHARLVEYVGQRIGYVEGNEAVLAATRSEAMTRFHASQEPLQAIAKEVGAILEKSGGRLADREVSEAMAIGALFMDRLYGPFLRGQVPQKETEAGLRGEVLPRLERLAEKTKEHRTAEGTDGSLARWAKAQLEYFRELAATLGEQQAMQQADARAQERWSRAEELRSKYLEELRAYRESLR